MGSRGGTDLFSVTRIAGPRYWGRRRPAAVRVIRRVSRQPSGPGAQIMPVTVTVTVTVTVAKSARRHGEDRDI